MASRIPLTHLKNINIKIPYNFKSDTYTIDSYEIINYILLDALL